MGEIYSSDELCHWDIPGSHKYIAKIGEGINAKYFYTQQQIDAYKNGLKGKVNNAAQNVQKKIPTANQVRQTARRVGQQGVAAARQTVSNIAKNAPGAANRAAMATRRAAVNAAGAALVNTKAGSKVLARQRNTAVTSGDTATLKRLNSFDKYRASNVKANVKQRINNNEYVKAAKATGEAAKAVGKAGKAAYQFAKTPYGKQVIKEVASNAIKQKAAKTVYNVADTAEKAKRAVENKAMSVVRNDAHNKSFESPLYTERTYTTTDNKKYKVKKKF